MKKSYHSPPTLPRPRNYSHAVACEGGRTIYLTGQVAFDPDRNIVGGGDVVEQMRHVFRNLKMAVEAAGGAMHDIVQITIYVVKYDPSQLDRIAGTIAEFFPADRLPANTLIGVESLSIDGLLIEISGIAVIDA